MRDLAYFGHLLLGVGLVVLPIIILVNLKEKPKWLKAVSAITAAISWLLLLPAGLLYLAFYPATKTVIKAGAWPWAHSIIMETKEHWGLLLPVVATVATLLVFDGKEAESKKWWILLLVVSFLIAIFGRIVKMGAGA
ncbi:MAG: hypothetical protein AABW85_05170 [archaeon]